MGFPRPRARKMTRQMMNHIATRELIFFDVASDVVPWEVAYFRYEYMWKGCSGHVPKDWHLQTVGVFFFQYSSCRTAAMGRASLIVNYK